MIRLLCSLLAAAFVALTAWVGGFNFDTRSFEAAFLLVFGATIGVWVWFYPGWWK